MSTHNTREVTRRIDDFYLQFCHEVNGKIKFDFDDAEIAIKWIQNNLQEMQDTHHQELQKAREERTDKLYGEGYYNGVIYERERIEAIFKEHVPPHAMDLEDSVWLKRLLNKAFNHDKNI